MTERFLREKIAEIKKMGDIELDAFAHTVSLSGISREAKDKLNEAVREQQKELDKKVSVMAVSSEIKPDY